jgi:hypothetical protein
MRRLLILLVIGFVTQVNGQNQEWEGKFEQLDKLLPTPNSFRNGAGAPGPGYWQQRADYEIDVELNEVTQLVKGSERITYFNNSPDVLTYLWLQLDQNLFTEKSIGNLARTSNIRDSDAALNFVSPTGGDVYEGGYKIGFVNDANGKPLRYFINGTMMRIDLPDPLKSGEKILFSIAWSYVEKDRNLVSTDRGGYEYFPEDKNYVYTCAQWFPRMCVYDDYEGWQNKQYLGLGEFALTFGNYKVRITVPSDHIVGATGTIQNLNEVLTPEQVARYEKAKTSFDKPLFIVTKEEAAQKEKTKSTKKSTWEFYAENVRDFAFASSRKFIWEIQPVKLKSHTPLAMSLYPKEGNPLWEKESTKAIKNTLEVYSERTIDYPYPVAYSVHTADQGMEYPMICFNLGRPSPNGSYSRFTLSSMIDVIVHEIGHNFFPMIINSDERQWSWMDEGLNSFLEKETLRMRYPELGFTQNTPQAIIPYMRGDKSQMRPVMSMSDNIRKTEFGSNAYYKPAAALTILRETVMGPDAFDRAFKEYSERWAFKHPKPGDFFRTMEDASGVDLDWFWKGWFYGTDHVDLDLAEVKWFRLKTEQPDIENKKIKVNQGGSLASAPSNTGAGDFSNGPAAFTIGKTPSYLNGEFRSAIDDNAIRAKLEGKNIYELTFKNVGGLISPIIIEWIYVDGSKETEIIPAEIWRLNENEVSKVFFKNKEVKKIVLDPKGDLSDVEKDNNAFPKPNSDSKFEQFKKSK